MAELLKVLGKIPPLSLLSICNPVFGKYATEHLLQHSDDLDFVQDVLTATGASKELNPILHSVLAGFGRRRRCGRFKSGQLNIHFDRLRFADTTTENDSDQKVKDFAKKAKDGAKAGKVPQAASVCRFFQQPGGCRVGSRNCKFAHRCIICDKYGHGATTCPIRMQSSTGPTASTGENQRPPNPRVRQSRANTA